jgi:hydrogenase maturation protease
VPEGVLVIGVGNDMRSDDGAGPETARRIAQRKLPGVVVAEHSGEGVGLMDVWNGFTTVVLIDASRSGAEPGEITRFDAAQAEIPTGFFHYSTHAFSVAEAIGLSRQLGRMPPRLIVYGVEGERFDYGPGLSPKVDQAVEALSDRIAAELIA